MTRLRLTDAANGLADVDLLARFVDEQNHHAFGVLVARHGPMVRAVCRSVLGNASDADDAFQAVFLVLARKAESIRRGTALGGWLYAVTLRVARKLKARGAKRVPTVGDLSAAAATEPTTPTDDLMPVLTEEIDRLPDKFRRVVHLCYIAGLSTAAAATELGVPKGTVLSRLASARERLQKQLTARGVTAAGVLLASLGTRPDLRAVEANVLSQTVDAVMTSLTPTVAGATAVGSSFTLSTGVLRDMALMKLKLTVGAVLLGTAVLGVGAGGLAVAQGKKPSADARPVENARPESKPVDPLSEPLGEEVPAGPPARPVAPGESNAALEARLRELERRLDELGRQPEAGPETAPQLTPIDPLLARNLELPRPTEAAVPRVTPPEPETMLDVFDSTTRPSTELRLPIGTWTRTWKDVTTRREDVSVRMTFTEKQLVVVRTVSSPNGPIQHRFEADYAVSPSGVVFGFVTSAESNNPQENPDQLQTYEEQPFSFRFRVTDGSLAIKDTKDNRPIEKGASPPKAPVFLLPGRYTLEKPAQRLDAPIPSIQMYR